jgi:hypothetical protein
MKHLLIYIAIIITITSCSDIFVKDISDSEVVLLAPHNNLETTLSTNTFWWDYVEDAEEYQLQVASPDFIQTERLILDTTIAINQFLFNLNPNKYEWRVRALNSVYETDFTVHSLVIDSTPDLTNETVILYTPLENDTSSSLTQNYYWSELYNAENYNLVVLHEGVPILDTITTETSITLEIPDNQGSYSWKVNARNYISETSYSERNYFIDTSEPLQRSLISPLDQSIISDSTVICTWNSPPIAGSSEYDSLYIYTDQSMGNPIHYAKVNDNIYETILNNGIYYWRVRGIDKAGNKGEYSDLWSFEISAK